VPRWFSCSTYAETAIGGGVRCNARSCGLGWAVTGRETKPHPSFGAGGVAKGQRSIFFGWGERLGSRSVSAPPGQARAVAVWPRGEEPSF
jgi:hypothetical protein